MNYCKYRNLLIDIKKIKEDFYEDDINDLSQAERIAREELIEIFKEIVSEV